MLRRVAAARGFAAKLASRYLHSPVQRRRPELQCLTSPIWTVTQLVRQYRFALTVPTPLARRERAAWPAAPSWRREIERVLVGTQAPRVSRHEHVAQTLVRRFESALELVRTHERVVTTSLARREAEPVLARRAEGVVSPAAGTVAQPALPALPLARRAPATPAPATPETVNGKDSPVTPLGSAPARAARAASLAEHEVERLAERVISSIDRRLIAQRERLGNH
jgi:hypothetical protein